MTPDELKSIPKGNFIVMKTGSHPLRTRLRLFLQWGITFEEPYTVQERVERKVCYADKDQLVKSIQKKYPKQEPAVEMAPAGTGMQMGDMTRTGVEMPSDIEEIMMSEKRATHIRTQ